MLTQLAKYMKITFLIQDLFQQGAEYVTSLLMRGFVDEGFEVDLLLSKVHADKLVKDDIAPFPIPAEVNVITLPSRRSRSNIQALRRYMRSSDSSAIVVMSVHYLPAIAIASIGLRRKPIIGYVEHDLVSRYRSQRIYFTNPILRSIIRRRVDRFMSVSNGAVAELEQALRLPEGSAVNVANPVIDSNYWDKLSATPRHPWLLDKSMPTFVAAGAHCDFKRHSDLLEAFRIVNLTTPARLILYGQGDLTPGYVDWIQCHDLADRISLPGHCDNLPAEIRAADGFIVSSERESFSIVLVEAMAAGVPVISTNCPYGPPDLLRGGLYGALVPIGDPEAMARAILAQISHPRPAAPPAAWQPYRLPAIVASYRRALFGL